MIPPYSSGLISHMSMTYDIIAWIYEYCKDLPIGEAFIHRDKSSTACLHVNAMAGKSSLYPRICAHTSPEVLPINCKDNILNCASDMTINFNFNRKGTLNHTNEDCLG